MTGGGGGTSTTGGGGGGVGSGGGGGGAAEGAVAGSAAPPVISPFSRCTTASEILITPEASSLTTVIFLVLWLAPISRWISASAGLAVIKNGG